MSTKKQKAYVNLVLNAHLPYIRQVENEDSFEEDWYYEAVVESYLPIVRSLKELDRRNVPFKITLVLSPSLIEMMKDSLLNERLLKYIQKHIELGNKEVARLANEPELLENAKSILQEYKTAKRELTLRYRSVLDAFLSLPTDKVEFISTAATHSLLPLYTSRPCFLNSSFAVSDKVHYDTFKKKTEGVWLPNGGYFPELDRYIKRNMLKTEYFFVPANSFALSSSFIERSAYAPIKTKSGLYAFALDASLQDKVTSPILGYPGDDDYREFYRDIGYDLPFSYIGDYVHHSENRGFTGYKYYAVSGKRETKEIYNKEKAYAKAQLHAEDFVKTLEEKADRVNSVVQDIPPIFNIAFDAELLGHWWKEGPLWLSKVISIINKSKILSFTNSKDYIRENASKIKDGELAYSYLSNGTYAYPYMDGDNNSLVRLIYGAIDTVEDLSKRFKNETNPIKRRYVAMAVKNVLLLSASDWPFILHNRTCPNYARSRIREHLSNIDKVVSLLSGGKIETSWLVKAEKEYPLFEGLDFTTFSEI